MEKQVYSKKTVVLWAVWLSVIAAAAFCSMDFFTRSVFGKVAQWQLSFAALAVCLILSAVCRRPLVSLGIAAVAAAAMWFDSPFFAGLCLPVALQAAVWESVREQTKTGKAALMLSMLCTVVTIPFRVRLWRYMVQNGGGSPGSDPIGEAFVCFAGLILITALWVWLFVKRVRCLRTTKKTPAKKRGRQSKQSAEQNLYPVAYAVCALNAALSAAYCFQMFTGEYVKLIFFVNGLFVCYLAYRRDPTLLSLLNGK